MLRVSAESVLSRRDEWSREWLLSYWPDTTRPCSKRAVSAGDNQLSLTVNDSFLTLPRKDWVCPRLVLVFTSVTVYVCSWFCLCTYVQFMCPYVQFVCTYVQFVCPYVQFVCSRVYFVCPYVHFVCPYVQFVCPYVQFVCPYVQFVCPYVQFVCPCVQFVCPYV